MSEINKRLEEINESIINLSNVLSEILYILVESNIGTEEQEEEEIQTLNNKKSKIIRR